jgi:hypothetical protein
VFFVLKVELIVCKSEEVGNQKEVQEKSQHIARIEELHRL